MATDRPLRTNVYVDGFNLYYGALKGTRYKWLNVDHLCRLIFPRNDIQRIRYFTALVQPRPSDQQLHVRQQAYLRAIQTLPNLTLHLGSFREDVRTMRLAKPESNRSPYVEVLRTEEKGSDVNLASWMLRDCFKGDFEAAIVVSNDTDLITPIEMVRHEAGCPVGLLNPYRRPARSLLAVASFYREIRVGPLSAAQFPAQLIDGSGRIVKPATW